MSAGRLAGRVAVVVGAGSRGVGDENGSAVAIALAREGASVACVDLDLSRAEATAELIRRSNGKATAVAADATRAADMERVVRDVVAHRGRIDVMHNNVGAGGVTGEPTRTSEEDWDREIAVNLKSAFLGIKYAVPVMEAQGGGVIINVSSTLAVRFLRAPTVAYSVAKAGVEALTNSCSLYYGRMNIRVNAIRIGFSETPLVLEGLRSRVPDLSIQEQELAKSRALVPLHRHGSAHEVAAAAVFLASDESSYISGVVLDVDGALRHSKL